MRSTRDSFPRHRPSRRGGATVELAILLPLLLTILVIATDYCRLFNHLTTITNCARNGALWASDPLAPAQSPYTTVQAATIADGARLNPPLAAANVQLTTGTDAGGNPTVTVTIINYSVNLVTGYLGLSSASLSRAVTMNVIQRTPD